MGEDSWNDISGGAASTNDMNMFSCGGMEGEDGMQREGRRGGRGGEGVIEILYHCKTVAKDNTFYSRLL